MSPLGAAAGLLPTPWRRVCVRTQGAFSAHALGPPGHKGPKAFQALQEGVQGGVPVAATSPGGIVCAPPCLWLTRSPHGGAAWELPADELGPVLGSFVGGWAEWGSGRHGADKQLGFPNHTAAGKSVPSGRSAGAEGPGGVQGRAGSAVWRPGVEVCPAAQLSPRSSSLGCSFPSSQVMAEICKLGSLSLTASGWVDVAPRQPLTKQACRGLPGRAGM